MLLIYFLVVFLLAVIAYQLFKLNKSKKLDSEIKEKERIEEKISKIFPYLYKKECEREFFIDREFFNCSYFEDIAKLLKLPLASFRDCDVSYSDKFSLMHKKRDSENDPVKKEKIQKAIDKIGENEIVLGEILRNEKEVIEIERQYILWKYLERKYKEFLTAVNQNDYAYFTHVCDSDVGSKFTNYGSQENPDIFPQKALSKN